jgi:hypothetical protein
MTGMLHKLDEVNIIFPVPGQAEIKVHGAIIRVECGK